MMTLSKLINELMIIESTGRAQHKVVICVDEDEGWDNIQDVKEVGGHIQIVFGGGSPFSVMSKPNAGALPRNEVEYAAALVGA